MKVIESHTNSKYMMKELVANVRTTDHLGETVDIFYDEIKAAFHETKTHFSLLCGDFNVKVG